VKNTYPEIAPSVGMFANCLSLHATHSPEKVAMHFYADQADAPETLTFRTLHEDAMAVASVLVDVAEKNDRVLIMHNDGPAFLKSFFGCLYAGTIPVPIFPPRDRRTFERFMVVVNDTAATALLLPSQFSDLLATQAGALGVNLPAHVIETDKLSNTPTLIGLPRPSVGSDIAFLQYTSGSTAAPKGVMVTNDALLANIRMIHHAMRDIEHGIMGVWLPMQHDMGLIGGLLSSVYAGHTCVLSTPTTFMRSPLHWLKLVAKHRVTHTALPNFAFDLCVSKTKPTDRAQLDLRALRFVWNAAEPVRARTMDRFTKAFAASNFDPKALYPSFGLAEATLTTTGMRFMHGVKTAHFVATDLDAGVATPAEAGASTRAYVSCGEALAESHLKIVNPETGAVCDDGVIGELWLAGPHIAAGYWNNPIATKAVFHNRLEGSEQHWLRTGDLGFLHRREVYITGRMKDLIIIRGRNIFPSDIEGSLEGVHPAMRPGCCAVFGIDHADEECVAVATEIRKDTPETDYADIARSIRKVVANEFSVGVQVVALLPQGGSFKTSSGKLQRAAMRKALESKKLEVLYVEEAQSPELPDTSTPKASADAPPSTPTADEAWMAQWLSERLHVKSVAHDTELSEYGIDSMVVAEFVAAIEERTGIRILDDAPWTHPTILAMGKHLRAQQTAEKTTPQAMSTEADQAPRPGAPLGALEGTIADFRDMPGQDLLDRTRPFQTWRRTRMRTGLWSYARTLYSAPQAALKTRLDSGANIEGINFGSIDYLGLSAREDIKEAAIQAIRDYGPHSASVGIFSGGSVLSRALETALSEHLSYPEVVLFPTGWMAGWGSVAGLVRPNDHVVLDLLAHNCLQQGARAATQRIRHFRHLDSAHAESVLAEIRKRDTRNGILVVSEGLFSMDSDWPDLQELQEICSMYDARLLVDISHDLASMGPRGTGQIGLQGLLGKIDLVMGGFSKGLAANGGFLACHSSSAREYLRIYADTNLFATAMPPPAAGVALKALEIARSEEGEHLRANLTATSHTLRDALSARGITCHGSPSPLIPVHVGTEGSARKACKYAMEHGVISNVVEFPAVPVGMARLRLQLMATHTIEQAEHAANIITEAIREAQE